MRRGPRQSSQIRATGRRVRGGEHVRQSYLRRLEELLEVKSAVRRGDLAGMIYVPDVDIAAGIIERIWSSANLADAPTLGDAAYESRRSARGLIFGALAGTEPIGYSYARVPLYILVSPQFFDNLHVRNGSDATACIVHELRHVKDGRRGMTLDGMRMEPSGGFGFPFLQSMTEVRAYNAELEYARSHGTGASATYLHAARRNYVDFCNGLSIRPRWNEKEYLCGEMQLAQFSDLTITRSGGRYEVSFSGR